MARGLTLSRRIFPHPSLTLLLSLVWCLLMNRLSPGTIAFGFVLGTAIPLLTAAYWPNRPVMQRPLRMVEYILVVIRDIVVANVQVALIVLFKRNADMRPNWVAIPLDLRTPEAIAILAGTIPLTPALSRPTCRTRATRFWCTRLTRPTPTRCATRSRAATNAA